MLVDRHDQAKAARSLRCLGLISVVLSPNESIYARLAWDRPDSGQERNKNQSEGEQHHDSPYQYVGVAARTEWRNLVPEGVEPQPRLTGVVARLVHHAPLLPVKCC